MTPRNLLERATSLPGAPGARALEVASQEWRTVAAELAGASGRLLTIWASGDGRGVPLVRAAFLLDGTLLVASMALEAGAQVFPGIEDLFPAADRLQRAVADLCGLRTATGDRRPWLRHAAWPAGFRPLIDAASAAPSGEPAADDYAFVRVEGEGVHEIPVGPVHAGIIEPGHFRFSVVGEKVLRLEERLGYVHKGIERRFTEIGTLEGHRLAARISGDSAVAFSWAWCQALEGLAACAVPERAPWLRALALELERIANHLGDLGALGNDAGFAFALAQFSRLKETCLRATQDALGQRYLMDFVVPGGTRADLDARGAARLRALLQDLQREIPALRAILDEHAGVRDRFVGAGIVTPELATRLGLAGFAARASGCAYDLRADLPCAPYDRLATRKAVRAEGDVAARVTVRFEELMESLRLIGEILERLPTGAHRGAVAAVPADALGIGLIEGWRGPVMIALETAAGARIRRCHPHDPSSLNWPALEHAVIGNIVPDFPLINKSFNLSYSGHDL